ncbi:hypothetical protein SBOR_1748 [Sclerotinia borealis F-4128]|uniref:cAMP-independent regulatory protein pac2 n=1 Tax=Sclerotinia borealis (strain F-4128) TaxID=1432307 RepID=W9CM74_SCLBF|nr:hypothetical protein SBOR_1748 [Sclerotinia borealis F-4128]
MDTYHGHVRTPADAIKLFEACRLGLLPRVQRRLSEKERQSIKSGSVFVWDEREAGMRRWTDGKSWSASRVSGSFLTYREMEGKRGGGQFAPPPVRRMAGKTPDSSKGSDDDQDMDGDGPDGYRYKPDGLMKQSFSITTSTGQHLHLISYYSRPHANTPELLQPTSDPALRGIVPVKGMYPESTVHEAQGPAVTRAPMQQGPYMQQPHPHMHPSQHRIPYGYSQGYGPWPPSPVSTPPYPHHQQMYPSQLPPPPPGSMHPSPYQILPGPPHTSPYQAHQYSPHHRQIHVPNHMPQGPPHPTIYDRPPPPLSNSSLPPPPPHGYQNSAPQYMHPSYQPHPSPRAEHVARVQVEQHAQMAQRVLQTGMIDPRLAQAAPLPPVNIHTNGTNGIQRMNTPPRQPSISPVHTPKSSRDQALSSPDGTPNGIGKSEAQTIPSISSLVHASDSVSVMADNRSNSSNNSRAGSNSPRLKELAEAKADEEKNALSVTTGTADIPHKKLSTAIASGAEDQRAIRVLDRKFMI